MNYKTTEKGKYAIKNKPEAYKKLLLAIKKEKVDVDSITADYKGNPIANITVYEVVAVKGSSERVIGHTYNRPAAVEIAQKMRKTLKDVDRVSVQSSNAYFDPNK